MKKALVITGGYINFHSIKLSPHNFDVIIACDSGYVSAQKLMISPNIIVGDFDSAEIPNTNIETIIAPAEKDETDTALACNIALEQGATDIVIVGGTGGRADHFLANVFLLESLKDKSVNTTLTDGENTLRIVFNEKVQIPNTYNYFSLFALDTCSVTLSGCKYPLSNYLLNRNNPLAVSNEVVGENATIDVKGKAILCESKK